MIDVNETTNDASSLQATLEERGRMIADYMGRELALVDEAMAAKAERLQWWEGIITENKLSATGAQLASYKSLASALPGLVGGSIREQAKLMVPFEIAEATKEFARFLGTRDPAALASSVKHALAAKQYAAAAKSGGAGGSSGGGGGGATAAAGPAAGAASAEPARSARVIVNVGRQVGLVDTYDFARELIGAINENLADDVVLEVAS